MKHLQQLDVFVNGPNARFLATTTGMKKLTLRYDYPVYNFNFLISLLEGIKQHRNSLPSVINIYVP